MNLLARIRGLIQPARKAVDRKPVLYVCPHCAVPYWRKPGEKVGLIPGLTPECIAAIHKAAQ